MVDKDHIHQLLKIHFRIETSYDINDDGSVSVSGDVVMIRAAGGEIPVKFNQVDGLFKAQNMYLNSLYNVPDTCYSLYVDDNRIGSLHDCPVYLGMLSVSNNRLRNFRHGPELVGEIVAFNNPLESLDGLPDNSDDWGIDITYSANLPLLKLLNASEIHLSTPGLGYSRLKPYEPVNSILKRYAGQGMAGSFACAHELELAGFKNNAAW